MEMNVGVICTELRLIMFVDYFNLANHSSSVKLNRKGVKETRL
jgi:hypothetical protein